MRIENTVNFTNKEKHLLLDKIGPYLPIIENKSIVAAASHAKSQVWLELAGIYNSEVQDVKRTATQLRNLYNNMKKRTRKSIKHKIQINTSLPIDEFGLRLITLLPELRKYSRFCNNVDSNHNQPSTSSSFESSATNTTFHEEDMTIKEEIEDVSVSDDSSVAYAPPKVFPRLASTPDALSNADYMDESSNDVKTKFYSKNCRMDDRDVIRHDVDVRLKEIEKLKLDIQLKEMQLQYMREKLKEQEINVKIKELEYQSKLVSMKNTCSVNNST